MFDRRLVFRGQSLACHALPNDRQPPTSRLGVVVPKRLAPTAVQRNRVKRVVRESFRALSPVSVAFDVVVRLADRLPAESPQEQKRRLAAESVELFGRIQRRLGRT